MIFSKMKKLLIPFIFLLVTACTGVQYSFRGGAIPGQTFSIEPFLNEAAVVNPSLVNEIQDELRRKLSSESNLKFNDQRGDAHFSGKVINYNISPVQGTGDQTVSLSRLTITIEVGYENTVDHTNDFSPPKRFSDYDDFEASDDFSSKEEELVQSITEKLVLQIYNSVLVDW